MKTPSRLLYLRLNKENFEKVVSFGEAHGLSLAQAGIHLLNKGLELELSLSEPTPPDILA